MSKGRLPWRADDPAGVSSQRLSGILFWVSRVYGGAAKLRRTLYKKRLLKAHRLPCPVISIGNLTVGGTGKTPMVAFVAKLLKEKGYRVAVLSRGYKGRAQKRGGVVSDGRSIFMTVRDAGDEPVMLANQLEGVPVLVGADRFRSGKVALERFQSNVLILDDGFQHLSLERDLDVVLMDYRYPLGNGDVLPRGPLREPVSALSAADGIVFTRCDDPPLASAPVLSPLLGLAAFLKKPVFFAAHFPVTGPILKGNQKRCGADAVKGKPGIAFSGIAQNKDFRRSLGMLNCDIRAFFEFPDHHFYTQEELEEIWQKGRREGAFFVATTEKDYARIQDRISVDIPLMVLGVRLGLVKDETEFSRWILGALKQ